MRGRKRTDSVKQLFGRQVESDSEIQSLRRDIAVVRQAYSSFASDISTSMSTIRTKAAAVKSVAVNGAAPTLDALSGRGYVNAGKKSLGEDSEKIVNRVDDLQDVVEDLRKDVVTRGYVLASPTRNRQQGHQAATAELKKMQEYLKERGLSGTRSGPRSSRLCAMIETFEHAGGTGGRPEDDLEKATQTFALVEQATKQQHLQTGPTGSGVRSTSRGFTAAGVDHEVDPVKAQEGVLEKSERYNQITRLDSRPLNVRRGHGRESSRAVVAVSSRKNLVIFVEEES
jgi:hypothetical protein